MPVVGFTINTIEAKREKNVPDTKEQLKINSTPKVTGIQEINLPSIGRKALVVEFDFSTTYTPNIGSIKVSGDLILVSEDNKKVLDAWEKNKSIPNDFYIEVMNYLFARCVLKILNLSDDLQLPPPLNLPFIAPTQENAQQGKSDSEDEKEKELKDKIKKLTSK